MVCELKTQLFKYIAMLFIFNNYLCKQDSFLFFFDFYAFTSRCLQELWLLMDAYFRICDIIATRVRKLLILR